MTEKEQTKTAPHGRSYAQTNGSQWAHLENHVPVQFRVSIF
jgi:hypothetical protein